MPIASVIQSVIGAVTRSVIAVANRLRLAYNFDGVDDRGQLTSRAINPDGDNTFEFWTPSTLGVQTILAQSISTDQNLREFQLFIGGSQTMEMNFGGALTSIYSAESGLKPATKYGLSLVGNTLTLREGGLSGTQVMSRSFVRGTAREPTAATLVGCRGNGAGAFSTFFQGPQYDVRINGVLYHMADRNQSIQLPHPSGLGAELITQSVLENPNVKGSQWTYLGGGRWQYIGDGSLNELLFLQFSAQPEAGFLEFEIESITGALMCTQSVAQNTFIFNTPGVKRYFYTQKNFSGITNAQCVTFKRNTGVVSCVIKNISFKPLGTCNPMTLVNTNPDRWQEVQP